MKKYKSVIPFYKHAGETPLEAVSRLRAILALPQETKTAYAGRLDPMAEGLILVLVGEGTKNIDDHLSLEKTYEATIVLGFSTDTFDALGLITARLSSFPSFETIRRELMSFEGAFSFDLPPFSSYKIRGKPLFHWARQGIAPPKTPPRRKTTISEIIPTDEGLMPLETMRASIIERTLRITGDFRQEQIRAQWEALTEPHELPYITATITCSAGTYIRALVDEFSKHIGTPAFLFALKRTKIGPFMIDPSMI